MYYTYSERGPGRVIENLKMGLAENDCKVLLNPTIPKGYISLLQDHPIWRDLAKKDALCGPNLFILPADNKEFCSKFDHFVCPSKWVHDKYRMFEILSHATLDVWSVGIDTERWKNKNAHFEDKKNVILYVKNRDQAEISRILNVLIKSNVRVVVMNYGSYEESQLMTACSKADACIVLTDTESQGIAYMQILSCDIPCYVVDTKRWNNGSITCIASSVPYFDETCGMKVDLFETNSFYQFLTNLKNYRPRDYILKNHTLKKSARRYLEILNLNNCKIW